MTNQELSLRILELVGGKGNVTGATNCMTRLRINLRDYNFFMAMTVFYTFIGLASGIIIDISYGIIDPRIRMGSKK